MAIGDLQKLLTATATLSASTFALLLPTKRCWRVSASSSKLIRLLRSSRISSPSAARPIRTSPCAAAFWRLLIQRVSTRSCCTPQTNWSRSSETNSTSTLPKQQPSGLQSVPATMPSSPALRTSPDCCSKPHHHGRASARCLFQRHRGAVNGGNLSNQRQPDAAAAPFGGEEGYEHFVALLRGDSGTIVRHHDGHTPVLLALRRQGNSTGGSALECLDCIANQIDEGLIKQVGVRRDLQCPGFDGCRQLDVACCEVVGEQTLESGEHPLDRYHLKIGHQALGQAPVVVNKAQQPLAAASHNLERFAGLGQCRGIRVADRQSSQHIPHLIPCRRSQ